MKADPHILGVMDEWRRKAINIVLVVYSVMAVPVVIGSLTGMAGTLPRGVLIVRTGFFCVLVLMAACYRLDPRLRGWVVLAADYIATAFNLLHLGLAGQGRLSLLIGPLWALILLGNRSAWVAAALSVTIYGGLVGMSAAGWLVVGQATPELPITHSFWMLQGFGLLMSLAPTFILLERFVAFQLKTLQAEREASRRLQDEIGKRVEAYRALEAEMAERQRLENEIVDIGEQERRHLGAEIHDGLCQQLTAAILNCSALEHQLAVRDPEEVSRATRLRNLLEDAIADASTLAKGLSPVDLDPQELPPALQSLACRMSDSSGIRCEFSHRGDRLDLDSEKAFHLLRIAQEAVHNAVRHARAGHIGIELNAANARITLQVRDDGSGLPTDAATHGGIGMRLMAYRAHLIKGTLTVESNMGAGTTVTCHLPAREPATGREV